MIFPFDFVKGKKCCGHFTVKQYFTNGVGISELVISQDFHVMNTHQQSQLSYTIDENQHLRPVRGQLLLCLFDGHCESIIVRGGLMFLDFAGESHQQLNIPTNLFQVYRLS